MNIYLILFSVLCIVLLLYILNTYTDKHYLKDNVNEYGSVSKLNKDSIEHFATSTSIPQLQKLLFYLTSFSDTNPAFKQTPTYVTTSQRWENSIVGSTDWFNINGTPVPASLTDSSGKSVGFALKNMKLIGPSSDAFSIIDSNGTNTFVLSSFSISIYCNIKTLSFAQSSNKQTIFKMYAETPNKLEWYISPVDTAHVNMNVVLDTTLYTWSVEKASLVSVGNTLLTITFDNDSTVKTLKFYIGTRVFISSVDTYTPITLGNSSVEINSDMALDAKMYAFLYYNTALTIEDIVKLNEYMFNQTSGFYAELNNLQTTAQANVTSLSNLLLDTANTYKSQISTCNSQLTAMQAKCVTNSTSTDTTDSTTKNTKWQINMEGNANN